MMIHGVIKLERYLVPVQELRGHGEHEPPHPGALRHLREDRTDPGDDDPDHRRGHDHERENRDALLACSLGIFSCDLLG